MSAKVPPNTSQGMWFGVRGSCVRRMPGNTNLALTVSYSSVTWIMFACEGLCYTVQNVADGDEYYRLRRCYLVSEPVILDVDGDSRGPPAQPWREREL